MGLTVQGRHIRFLLSRDTYCLSLVHVNKTPSIVSPNFLTSSFLSLSILSTHTSWYQNSVQCISIFWLTCIKTLKWLLCAPTDTPPHTANIKLISILFQAFWNLNQHILPILITIYELAFNIALWDVFWSLFCMHFLTWEWRYSY